MVCGGVTSRLEVAQYLINGLGLTEKVTIIPVNSDYFSDEYFAPRPASERLIAAKLTMRDLNIMRDWRVCLDEYIAEYYAGYLVDATPMKSA